MKREDRNRLKDSDPDLLDELDKQKALEITAKSEGGRLFVSTLKKDVISSVDTLASKYLTLTKEEFIGYCASISVKLDALRILNGAKLNRELIQESLEEILKQEANGV